MTIQPECLNCISNQAKRVCDAIEASDALTSTITHYVDLALQEADFTLSPPVLATPLYEKMAEFAGVTDLYIVQKSYATQQALGFINKCTEAIETSLDPFDAILKTAVVGNVIDLAAEVSFDLHEAIHSIYQTPFVHDDSNTLHQQLANSKTLLYIADNAGEHIFDGLAIKYLRKLFPHLEITYMVRGKPIINDVTLHEAKEAKMDEYCHVMDSGVPTPGFVYELASKEAQNVFNSADIILAKGMGNYECLTPQVRENICFLLKVKCSVVARSLEQNIGDIVCKLQIH